MPKSKIVKQREAQERKRELYNRNSIWWRKHQVGGEIYSHNLKHHGLKHANEEAMHADKLFKRYLKEAGIDSNGNFI